MDEGSHGREEKFLVDGAKKLLVDVVLLFLKAFFNPTKGEDDSVVDIYR